MPDVRVRSADCQFSPDAGRLHVRVGLEAGHQNYLKHPKRPPLSHIVDIKQGQRGGIAAFPEAVPHLLDEQPGSAA